MAAHDALGEAVGVVRDESHDVGLAGGAVEPNDNTVPKYAGYIRSFGGLTHMTVGGAGHLVPMDQPERAQDMIQRFVRGQL